MKRIIKDPPPEFWTEYVRRHSKYNYDDLEKKKMESKYEDNCVSTCFYSRERYAVIVAEQFVWIIPTTSTLSRKIYFQRNP